MRRREDSKKRLNIRIAGALLIALAGICLLLYPKVDNLLYENKVAAEKEAFQNKIQETRSAVRAGYVYSVENYDDDDHYNYMPDPYEELYQFLKAENERLFETGQDELIDAFSYQTAGIDLSGYGLEDECIGYLEVPSIGIQLPIYLGANSENMSKGAVHMTHTSYPIGGNNTNAVIAAHRGGTREMLRNIHQIQIGDEVIITNFKERLVYQAKEIRIIMSTDVSEVKIQEGRDLITLLTCNPLGNNYQRYVLYCERSTALG